jgi:hypothetical protein
LLVVVGGCGVEEAVAGLEGGFDSGLGLVLGDLEDAESDDGHRDAVVEGDGPHDLSFLSVADIPLPVQHEAERGGDPEDHHGRRRVIMAQANSLESGGGESSPCNRYQQTLPACGCSPVTWHE